MSPLEGRDVSQASSTSRSSEASAAASPKKSERDMKVSEKALRALDSAVKSLNGTTSPARWRFIPIVNAFGALLLGGLALARKICEVADGALPIHLDGNLSNLMKHSPAAIQRNVDRGWMTAETAKALLNFQTLEKGIRAPVDRAKAAKNEVENAVNSAKAVLEKQREGKQKWFASLSPEQANIRGGAGDTAQNQIDMLTDKIAALTGSQNRELFTAQYQLKEEETRYDRLSAILAQSYATYVNGPPPGAR